MIRPRLRHIGRRSVLPTLRAYARRSLRRHTLTREERRNLYAASAHPAVYSASLGCHPHL